jgi:hypothetical protein
MSWCGSAAITGVTAVGVWAVVAAELEKSGAKPLWVLVGSPKHSTLAESPESRIEICTSFILKLLLSDHRRDPLYIESNCLLDCQLYMLTTP